MTRSRNTIPPRRLVRRRISRSPTMGGWVPRIITRNPFPGEVHPLSRKTITNYLAWVPLELIINLKAVELAPRNSAAVGSPYGEYRPNERLIRLYSAPEAGWRIGVKYEGTISKCGRYGAIVDYQGVDAEILWPDRISLESFFVDILLHELGHHYVHLNRHRRKLPITDRGHEYLAGQWAERLKACLIRSRGPAAGSLALLAGKKVQY